MENKNYNLEIEEDKIIIHFEDSKPLIVFMQRHSQEAYIDVIEHVLEFFWCGCIENLFIESLSYWSWRLKVLEKRTHYRLHERENPFL